MKIECKLIQIKEANPPVIESAEGHYLEELVWSSSKINMYLSDGWQIKKVFPWNRIPPPIESQYVYPLNGIGIYMERKIEDNTDD